MVFSVLVGARARAARFKARRGRDAGGSRPGPLRRLPTRPSSPSATPQANGHGAVGAQSVRKELPRRARAPTPTRSPRRALPARRAGSRASPRSQPPLTSSPSPPRRCRADPSELAGPPELCEETFGACGIPLTGLSFNPPGTLLAAGGSDGRVVLFDWQSRAVARDWRDAGSDVEVLCDADETGGARPGGGAPSPPARTASVAVAAHGRVVVAGCSNGALAWRPIDQDGARWTSSALGRGPVESIDVVSRGPAFERILRWWRRARQDAAARAGARGADGGSLTAAVAGHADAVEEGGERMDEDEGRLDATRADWEAAGERRGEGRSGPGAAASVSAASTAPRGTLPSAPADETEAPVASGVACASPPSASPEDRPCCLAAVNFRAGPSVLVALPYPDVPGGRVELPTWEIPALFLEAGKSKGNARVGVVGSGLEAGVPPTQAHGDADVGASSAPSVQRDELCVACFVSGGAGIFCTSRSAVALLVMRDGGDALLGGSGAAPDADAQVPSADPHPAAQAPSAGPHADARAPPRLLVVDAARVARRRVRSLLPACGGRRVLVVARTTSVATVAIPCADLLVAARAWKPERLAGRVSGHAARLVPADDDEGALGAPAAPLEPGPSLSHVVETEWTAAAVSPCGRWVAASARSGAHVVYVWDACTGNLDRVLEGPRAAGAAVALAWHPNCVPPQLLSVGGRGSILVWAKAFAERWYAFAPDFVELRENRQALEHAADRDIDPAGGEKAGDDASVRLSHAAARSYPCALDGTSLSRIDEVDRAGDWGTVEDPGPRGPLAVPVYPAEVEAPRAKELHFDAPLEALARRTDVSSVR